MGIRGEGEGQKAEVGGVQRGSKRGGSAFHFTLFICHDWVKKKKKAAISRCRRGAECIRMDRKWNSLSLSPFKIMMKNGLHTHILVLAVDVSQSAASPTMSNPVESWLKYLGWAELKKKKGAKEKWEGEGCEMAAIWTFYLAPRKLKYVFLVCLCWGCAEGTETVIF